MLTLAKSKFTVKIFPHSVCLSVTATAATLSNKLSIIVTSRFRLREGWVILDSFDKVQILFPEAQDYRCGAD